MVQYGTPDRIQLIHDNTAAAIKALRPSPSVGYVAPPSTVYVPTYQYAPYPYAYNYGYYPGVYFGWQRPFYGRKRFNHGGF